jgi:hypothetical protein
MNIIRRIANFFQEPPNRTIDITIGQHEAATISLRLDSDQYCHELYLKFLIVANGDHYLYEIDFNEYDQIVQVMTRVRDDWKSRLPAQG